MTDMPFGNQGNAILPEAPDDRLALIDLAPASNAASPMAICGAAALRWRAGCYAAASSAGIAWPSCR